MTSPAPQRRVLMLSFDALELTTVRLGIEEGWLPNLADVASRGASVTVHHPRPELPGSTWPTTIFGMGPERHGVIFDRQLKPGTYQIVDFPSEAAKVPPFWKHLSDAGVSSTISSIYGNRLVDGLRGTQIVGWGSYDPYSAKKQEPRGEPAEALLRLEEALPKRRSGFLPSLPRRERDYRFYLRETLAQIEMQTAAIEILMKETEWGFFFASYCHPHEAGHLMWHRPADIRRVYAALDREIGRLAGIVPEDASLLLMTPHGMGDNLHARLALDTMLERGGWLYRDASPHGRKATIWNAAASAYRHLPYELRWTIGKRLPIGRWQDPDPLVGVDWSRTKAFQLPHDKTALIRLNVRGREPAGIVAPGSEYDETLAGIAAAARELTNAETGKPIVTDVVEMRDVLGGPIEDVMPDLVIFWDDVVSHRLGSKRLGEASPQIHDPRTGDHPPRGFVIAAGPHTATSGELFKDEGEGLPDIAATVFALLGVAQPPELPGRPLRSLIA